MLGPEDEREVPRRPSLGIRALYRLNDPDRERRAKGHAEPDAEQGHERRLFKESEPRLSSLEAQGAELRTFLSPDVLEGTPASR